MSQISDKRRRIKIRRVVGFSLVGLIALTGILYSLLRPEPLPTVRTSELYRGNINSSMMLSAEIIPGSINYINPQTQQKVLQLHVKEGDQVKAGDKLATLDQSELEDQYNQAKEARIQIEESINQTEKAAQAQAEAVQSQITAAEQASQQLQHNITELSANLSSSLSRLVRLNSMQPIIVDINPDLNIAIEQLLQNFDSESENSTQQTQEIIELILQEITYSENPDYQEQMTLLQNELTVIADLTGDVLSSLVGSAGIAGTAGSINISDGIAEQLSSQLGTIGSTLETALFQAENLEEMAKTNLDNSRSELIADNDGIIAAINIQPGDYAGRNNSQAINSFDLSSITNSDMLSAYSGNITSDLISGASVNESAIVIYDNTRPKASFQASQFDSGRIKTGLPVIYKYEDMNLNGKIEYISPIASTGSIGTGSISDLTSDFGSFGEFGTEPRLTVEMSIQGTNLEKLIPGFYIDAEIETASAENVLILPAEAMRRELDKYFVFTVDKDNIIKRKVFTPGIQSDMSVEVIDGLNESDIVVMNPPSSIEDGIKVQVQYE